MDDTDNISNFQSLEVVDRGSETRIQVSEKNKLNTSYLLGLNSKLAKKTAEDISTCI